MDYFKLNLRNRKKNVHCPICERNIGKIRTIILCKKCDEKFSRYSNKMKEIVVETIKVRPNKSICSLCSKKGLKADNRLIYCADCDISFHL